MPHLQLFSLTGSHFDEEVFEVFVPTTAGEIAIYQGHAPLVGAVAPGLISVRRKRGDKDADREIVAVFGGAVEVLNNQVRVLVDEVETSESVTASEAEKALARAEELKSKAKDALSLQEAQQMIDRSQVRLQLASIKKHKHR
jgi:F-type H+-transporting ATPase subunit epsilon